MQMTDEEIVRSYNNAANKKLQPQILADLNQCDKKTIVEKLYYANALHPIAVARYRESGMLPAIDTPKKEKKQKFFDGYSPDLPYAGEKHKKKEEPKPVKVEEPIKTEEPVKVEEHTKKSSIPDSVLELITEKLNSMEDEYRKAKTIVTTYEELLGFIMKG